MFHCTWLWYFLGKALLCEDNLVVAKKFDHVSKIIDALLDNEKIKKFPLPTLNVSINVHRHLLEMVRHPGYISTTFDECKGMFLLLLIVSLISTTKIASIYHFTVPSSRFLLGRFKIKLPLWFVISEAITEIQFFIAKSLHFYNNMIIWRNSSWWKCSSKLCAANFCSHEPI